MSSRVREFLEATDLDDLLRLFGKLKEKPDDGDAEAILEVLERWENEQAVSNILIHPTVIPEAKRLSFLFKALEQRKVPYYILAALVGLQSLEPDALSHEDRERVLDRLFEVLRLDTGVMAQRATVPLLSFVRLQDMDRLLPHLDHSNKTVRQNVLVSLVKLLGKDDAAERIGSGSVSAERQAELLALIQRDRDREAQGSFPLLSLPLLAYIPNYCDCVGPG